MADKGDFKDALKYYEQAAEIWNAIGVRDLVESILNPRVEEVKKQLMAPPSE